MCNCVGNDNLHLLTSDTCQRLRVDLADFNGNSRYAEYDHFRVGSAAQKYKLESTGTYSGDAGQYTICRTKTEVSHFDLSSFSDFVIFTGRPIWVLTLAY